MTTKNVHTALIEFQKKGIVIGKDKTNPHYKQAYADIADILSAIQIPLAECGLYIVNQQATEHPEMLITSIVHAETQTNIQTITDLRIKRSDMQSIGSALTYARRYALSNLLSLVIDDGMDDDGNRNISTEKYQPKQAQQPTVKAPTSIPPEKLESAINKARAGELTISQFNVACDKKMWELSARDKARVELAIKEYNEERLAEEEDPF